MGISKKFAFFLLWTISSVYAIAGKYWVDGIFIKVNDSKVLLSEYFQAIEEAKKQFPQEPYEDIKKAVIDNFLQELLMLERAKELGYSTTKEELKRAFDVLAEKNNMPDGETFLKAAEEAGIPREIMEEKIRKEILIEKVLGNEILPAHDLTELELKEYYEKIKENFKENKKYHLKEIVLTDLKTMEEKTKTIQKELKEGKSFEELALKYSEVPSKTKGGDIGLVEEEGLAEEIKKALEEIKEGEVTKPIVTKYGIHFIYLEKIIPQSYKPFEEVKDTVKEDYKKTKYEETVKKYIENLKSRYLIQINYNLLEEPK
jgi:parvulin-like peptidyl-prolyl isomerase